MPHYTVQAEFYSGLDDNNLIKRLDKIAKNCNYDGFSNCLEGITRKGEKTKIIQFCFDSNQIENAEKYSNLAKTVIGQLLVGEIGLSLSDSVAP